MELKAVNTAVVVGAVFLYAAASLLLTCGCTLQIGEAPCRQYVHAIEQRLTECGLWDDWYRSQVQKVAAQCDDAGPLGLTLTEESDVADCVEQVRAATCERMSRGAPTCIGTVRL